MQQLNQTLKRKEKNTSDQEKMQQQHFQEENNNRFFGTGSTDCFSPPDRVTGGELFDRIVEKGSYSEKDAADLIKQVKGKFTIKTGQSAGSF